MRLQKIKDDVVGLVETLDISNDCQIIDNKGKTDYQSQVNLAVKSVKTEYFSIMEFDDELSVVYIKVANNYIKSYPDVDVLLTMMVEINEKNEYIKMTNETVWSQQFVGENGEAGYLNVNSLKTYTDFKLSGALIKKSIFEEYGGLKSNIELTFNYEFMLRVLNNGGKIFSISKVLYKHWANREGSMFDLYAKNMSSANRKFWFDTAVKESNFTTDRDSIK